MGYRVMELGAAGDGKTNDAHVTDEFVYQQDPPCGCSD